MATIKTIPAVIPAESPEQRALATATIEVTRLEAARKDALATLAKIHALT